MDADTLMERARAAADRAVVPFSEFPVGAALQTADGEIIGGCNIETANYSNSLHAEEVAIAQAIFNGHRDFSALAVAAPQGDGVTPCGMCRQTLWEFCPPEMPVYVTEGDRIVTYELAELLPAAFDTTNL